MPDLLGRRHLDLSKRNGDAEAGGAADGDGQGGHVRLPLASGRDRGPTRGHTRHHTATIHRGDATIARRGSSGWKLEVKGKRAHSAGIFSDEDGAGAIFEVSRILNQFYEQLHAEEYLTFNPGVMLAGTFVEYDDTNFKGTAFGKSNVIPQSAVVTGGLRFISEEQKEKTRVTMKEIVSNNYPNTGAKITFWDSYPAMPPTDGNTKVMEVLSQVSTDMNQGEVIAYDPLKRGAADISFVAKYTDGIDGLGAMGGGGHTPQEYVDLITFETLTKRTALLIYRLTR